MVTTAIHNGHKIRPEVLPFLKLSENERLREEDPHTGEWVKIADNRIEVQTSRFEVDVNRPREKAVYRKPEDAWGLELWNDELPDEVVEKSLHIYDEFYRQVAEYFDDLLVDHKNIIVYDLHSYNHRREGYDKYANADENPEINIGTRNLDREAWGNVIDKLMYTMQSYNFEGRHLDIRENVKFGGGYFGKWLYEQYGSRVCILSIEVKKFFMDEWSGESYEPQVRHVRELLISTIKPVLTEAGLTLVS